VRHAAGACREAAAPARPVSLGSTTPPPLCPTRLQTGAILGFDKMVEKGVEPAYASKLIQYGWETITEALKHGGITGMMDRLDNPSKIKAAELSDELKEIMRPLYNKHQDDIITGHFSKTMMVRGTQRCHSRGTQHVLGRDARGPRARPPLSSTPHPSRQEDWDHDDANLLKWRAETAETGFEKTPAGSMHIPEQEYFDHGVLLVAMCKAGVELAFEAMVNVGMKPESAYVGEVDLDSFGELALWTAGTFPIGTTSRCTRRRSSPTPSPA